MNRNLGLPLASRKRSVCPPFASTRVKVALGPVSTGFRQRIEAKRWEDALRALRGGMEISLPSGTAPPHCSGNPQCGGRGAGQLSATARETPASGSRLPDSFSRTIRPFTQSLSRKTGESYTLEAISRQAQPSDGRRAIPTATICGLHGRSHDLEELRAKASLPTAPLFQWRRSDAQRARWAKVRTEKKVA